MQLTHIKQGVSSPVVSHAGDRIALSVTDSDPEHDAYIDFAKAGFTPKAAQKKTDIHIIDQLFFASNGQGYTYQDHQHIWTIERRRLERQAADLGAILRRLRRVVARRPHAFSLTRCVTSRSTAASTTYTRCRPPAERCRRWRRRCPPTTASSIGVDGKRVYYFTFDVSEPADAARRRVGAARRRRSPHRRRRRQRVVGRLAAGRHERRRRTLRRARCRTVRRRCSTSTARVTRTCARSTLAAARCPT